MNVKLLSTISAILGITIVSLTGSAIASRIGLGGQSWLMMVFALGIVLLSQAPVLTLRKEVRDMQARLAARD